MDIGTCKPKLAALLLIVALTASTLIMIESASAQSTPKPSVPELVSLTYVSSSYYVPPTYGVDPYTGENVTTKEGYYVNKRSIVANVSNQPFTPYNYTANNYTSAINLYYNFRYKGHFEDDWKYFPINPQTGLSTNRYYAMFYYFADFPNFTASSTQYSELPIDLTFLFSEPPAEGQMDFQVQAEIGRIDPMGDGFYYFVGESSDWSNTQTIDLADGSVSDSTSPNPTPTDTLDNPTTPPSTYDNQPEANDYTPTSIPLTTFLLVTAVFIGIIAVLLILLFQRQKNR